MMNPSKLVTLLAMLTVVVPCFAAVEATNADSRKLRGKGAKSSKDSKGGKSSKDGKSSKGSKSGGLQSSSDPPAMAMDGAYVKFAATCPQPDGETLCTMEYRPVLCSDTMGEESCMYSNLCVGKSAGWLKDQCKEPTCPKKVAARCTKEKKPLICGANLDLSCYYDNKCLAEAHGWSVKQECDGSCPTNPQKSVCPAVFEPVTCGTAGCSYSNECVARSYRWDFGKDCTKDEISENNVPNIDAEKEATCPPPDEDTVCTMEYRPILCGATMGEESCMYSNLCVGESAGWVKDQCKEPTCPKKKMVSCTKERKPLTCGANLDLSCHYDNECLAEAHGWIVKQECDNSCPSGPQKVDCIEVYDPVTCGTVGCSYSNECVAGSYGWDFGKDCTKDNP
jgi:hypothetical protein